MPPAEQRTLRDVWARAIRLAGRGRPAGAAVSLKAFARGLTALPVLVPGEETWASAERWTAPAADAGHRFAVTDLVIAALADQIGSLVWSIDDDFAPLEQLGAVRLYAPPDRPVSALSASR